MQALFRAYCVFAFVGWLWVCRSSINMYKLLEPQKGRSCAVLCWVCAALVNVHGSAAALLGACVSLSVWCQACCLCVSVHVCVYTSGLCWLDGLWSSLWKGCCAAHKVGLFAAPALVPAVCQPCGGLHWWLVWAASWATGAMQQARSGQVVCSVVGLWW